MLRNFRVVPRLIFGRESFSQLEMIISSKRKNPNAIIVFLIDDVFKATPFKKKIPLHKKDLLIWANVSNEPKTEYVDQITSQIKNYSMLNNNENPSGIIGIGGGSTMDLAKAVSLMLTNPGSSQKYQGWDLIKQPGIYHVGIPTLSGTGSEVSRTTVLIGPEKKLGINSDYTIFDQIILDPKLTKGAPKSQRFYTGMDAYIHCVESLCGTYINTFSETYAQKAIELCQEVFLKNTSDADDKLMMASYFGGMSIAYSQVGICHAMSYGLSFVMGIHHGLANCIIFNILDEFYPKWVQKFRDMINKQEIVLPQKIILNLPDTQIEKMIDVALLLEPLWENAIGKNWKSSITRSKLKKLYLKI